MFDSIIQLRRNADAAAFLVDQVLGFLQAQKSEFIAGLDDYYEGLTAVQDNAEPTPLEMWPNVESSGITLQLADALGFRVEGLVLDLSDVDEVIVNRRLDLHQFDVCRERQGLVVARQADVRAYQTRVRKVSGALRKLEKAIANYEESAKAWVQSAKGGAPIVEMLYTISLIGSVTDVYRDVDPAGGFANNLSREMSELVLQTMEKERRKALAQPLERLAELYFDGSVLEPFAEYLAHWDPSDRFYLYEVAEQSSGLAGFGDRVFHAIQKVSSYAIELEPFAAAVASEVRGLYPLVAEIDKRDSVARVLAAHRPKVHKAIVAALGETGGGFMTLIGVWNGYVANLLGNFEGPPSVASLVLSHWASSKNFIPQIYSALTKESLKNTLLLIGITKTERDVMLAWIARGELGQEKTRELFKTANWRGTSAFAVFGAFQVWTLLTHVKALIDGKKTDTAAEVTKATISVVQDIGGLYLTGATIWHDKYVNNFLRSTSRNLTGRRFDEFFQTTAASNPMRVVRMVHRSLATLAVVMAGWDLLETRGRRDEFESLFKITALGGAGLSLLGAFGSAGPLAALGPWGFMIGFAAGVGAAVYDKWVKSDLKKVLTGLLTQVQGSEFNALYGGSIKLRAPEQTDPKICDGVSYFVSVTDPFVPWSTLVSLLADDIHDFSWGFGKTLPSDAIGRLYRAGLRPSSIAVMLERDDEEVRAAIKKSVASAPTFRLDRTLRIEPSEPPFPETVVWEPGVAVKVSLTLSGRHTGPGPRFVWLEWAGSDDEEDILLPPLGTPPPFNNYDADKSAVVLPGHKVAGFKGGKLAPTIYRFSGHLYLRQAPPSAEAVDIGGTLVRRAVFDVMVPNPGVDEEVLLKSPRPKAMLSRRLELPVRVR